MRQFAQVSISPWANPYTGAAAAPGKSFYATTTPQPLAYRRIVLPPDPIFYHPDIEQVKGEDSDDDQTPEAPLFPPILQMLHRQLQKHLQQKLRIRHLRHLPRLQMRLQLLRKPKLLRLHQMPLLKS
ncbi:hypothetical protein BKA66DRAFT_89190 [Pyrenochaeta sp. MPI-SDFR-AT-0127]|nr:hypothetical protein BKA66DRAFT_89190 [Pyrenochaeta sp. MPI-SDFR-AT-0127]